MTDTVQKSTEVPNTPSETKIADKTAENKDPSKDEVTQSTSTYNYIFIGVLSVVLILLLYYAYSRFVENSVEEPFTKEPAQERDDPVIDFNLREAIKELQALQRNIMSTISDNSDI